MHHVEDAGGLLLRCLSGTAAPVQPKQDIVQDVHMREQGVGLKDHADIAPPEREPEVTSRAKRTVPMSGATKPR